MSLSQLILFPGTKMCERMGVHLKRCDILRVVASFYARVLDDDVWGPVFAARVRN